jgi:hypothetical protein
MNLIIGFEALEFKFRPEGAIEERVEEGGRFGLVAGRGGR